jgi:hypothetical protein
MFGMTVTVFVHRHRECTATVALDWQNHHSDMATSSLDIPEIWDEILDHLQTSPKDLRSPALVCRSFARRAQSHIFRTIILVPSLRSARTTTTTTLAGRLKDIMTMSPHLIFLVQVLIIANGDEETISSLAQISWSRVHTLSLGIARRFDATAVATILDNMKTLVSVPSLRTLVFSGPFWDAAYLRIAFAHCTVALEHVRFRNCWTPIGTPMPTHGPPLDALFSPHPRPGPKLSSITLVFSPAVVDILRDPECALDSTSIRRVRAIKSMSPGFGAFVQRAKAISHLHLQGKGA